MTLCRMIYVSTPTEQMQPDSIYDILNAARNNNVKNSITGMLGFTRKRFFQYLEGSKSDINTLFQIISDDKRHTDIQIIDFSEIHKREFSDWSMGFVPESSISRECIIMFSESDEFKPYSMSAETLRGLLLALRIKLPMQS